MSSPVVECTSYTPGHRIHWIQVMHARDSQTASVYVALVRRSDSHVDVIVDSQVESWRFHDTRVNRQHLDSWESGEQAWLRPHGLLFLEGGGCLHPCRHLLQWQDCPPPVVTG